MIEKKERNSNIELYRIIVMLLIVMHHYVVNSGLLDEMFKTPFSTQRVYFYICLGCGERLELIALY